MYAICQDTRVILDSVVRHCGIDVQARTTKKPRKTGAFHHIMKTGVRDYPRTLSNLILRVQTAADRRSLRRSGRSSSRNYQRKQSADGTGRLKMRSRQRQFWTLERPFETGEFSDCIALQAPRHSQSRYTRCQTQLEISHSSILPSASQHRPEARRNVSTFPHSIKDLKVPKNHKKRPAECAGLRLVS